MYEPFHAVVWSTEGTGEMVCKYSFQELHSYFSSHILFVIRLENWPGLLDDCLHAQVQ